MVRTFANSERKTAIVGRFGALFSVFLLLATLFNLPALGETSRESEVKSRAEPIEILEDTVFEDRFYTLNTSLIVRSGAILEIRNSTLVFEQGNAIPELLVEYRATLRLENSIIKSNFTQYRFIVHGTLFCENSTILGTWAGENYGGLILNTNSATIRNSTIGDTEIGLYLPGMGNKTLLVDDDHNESVEKFYYALLSSMGIGFDYWCVEEQGIPTDLKNYSVVLWFTGCGKVSTLNITETLLLSDYLNTSGKLILTGQGIGRDINSTYLYTAQLNAMYGGHTSSREVLGTGFLANFSGWINAKYSLTQGYVLTQPENAVLHYGDGKTAGVAVKANYMVFYTEFSIDCLADEEARMLLLNVFNWFGIFVSAPQVTLYNQNFENFTGESWDFADGTGNGTWGLSDSRAFGNKSLWCAGNASKDAESIAFYESFEEFSGSTDTQPFNGVDAFGLSDTRIAEGNYSLWCAGQGMQWEDQGLCVAFEDFTEFHLKAWDENKGSGLDYWGPFNGKAWCAGSGDEMAIMNIRARMYDNFMNAVMYLPVSIPYDFATVSFNLELAVASGDYLEVGYVSAGKHIVVRKYESEMKGIEKLFISRFADAVYFRFVSDGSNVSTGAWIDDVEVRAYNYTTYLATDFSQGLGNWKSYDADERSGFDTWGILKRNDGYEAWCAGQGAQSNLFDTVYSPVFSEDFDYGLVNWRNNGTKSWVLGNRNLTAPFSAHATISDNSSVFPLVALLETAIDVTDTRSQKFDFDLVFLRSSDRTKFFVEVYDGEWKRVYEQSQEWKRWSHCSFVTAIPFTAIRFGLVGNGEIWLDNIGISATKSIPNLAVMRYDSFMDASLEHEVNFTNWEQVQIDYSLFYNLSERDYLNFEVYTDSWKILKTYSGTLTMGPFTEILQLPENAKVLRFRFISDRANEFSGVFLKHVRVYGIKSVSNLEAKRADRGIETSHEFTVNLTNYTSAILSYLLWLDLSPEQNLLLFLQNSTTTLELANYTMAMEQRKWVSQELDLTEFVSQEIKLKFVFIAKHYGDLTEGAYIDAIKVSGTTTKLYKSNMDAKARFSILLDCKKPLLEFDYSAELAENSAFRVSVNSIPLFETTSSTSGWSKALLSLEEFENLNATIEFEFVSSAEVSGGVYIDNIKIGGVMGYQDGEIVIENTEIYAQDYGMIVENRNLTISAVQISAGTGIWLKHTNLTAFSLRMNYVEVDAKLEQSTLYAYDDNLNPKAILCETGSSVYSNRSITVEIEHTKQGIFPEGSDVFGNPLVFVRKNNSAVASQWYFVKNGSKLQWYAPYSLVTSNSILKIICPPITLPRITCADSDEDGLYNVNENSENIKWLDASNFQEIEKVTDNCATLYGVNWTFKKTNVTNGVVPKSTQQGMLIGYSTVKCQSLNLERGTYRVLFRARSSDPHTDRIVVLVDTDTQIQILNTSLCMEYQWYETESFVVGSKGLNDLKITGYSTQLSQNTANYTLFEKLAFIRISDEKGNPTDLYYKRVTSQLIRDCDDDALADGIEFPGFANASAYIEAEWLGTSKIVEKNASNGLALRIEKGEVASLDISLLNFTRYEFDALVRVRARTEDCGALKLEAGSWQAEVNLTNAYQWYAFTGTLNRNDLLNFTSNGTSQIIDKPSVLIDRINIFDLTTLTRTSAIEGSAINISKSGTFHINVPARASLNTLSFNITASPGMGQILTKEPVVSVATTRDWLIWIESNGIINAYSLLTGEKITIGKRDPSARNLTASETLVAWEEEISGSPHVCIAPLTENAKVLAYQGIMPDVENNTVVFLNVEKGITKIHLVKNTSHGFVETVLEQIEGTGETAYLSWDLSDPKIYGDRMLLSASAFGWTALILIDFSDFVADFSGKKFHVSLVGSNSVIPNYGIWGEHVVWVDGMSLYVYNLSTGQTNFITDAQNIVDFKLYRGILAIAYQNFSGIDISCLDLTSAKEKHIDAVSSSPMGMAFSEGLLAVWLPYNNEIDYYTSHVSVDLGADGSIEWEHNSFIMDENTGNLLSRARILSYTANSNFPVSIVTSGNATISGIYAAFTTFTDPFLQDTDFDGLSDGVEFESYFPVSIVHLEDALDFRFSEKADNSYLQFGVVLSANAAGYGKLAVPFIAETSGHYTITTSNEEIIKACFEVEEGEEAIPDNLSEMVQLFIIDGAGKQRTTNISWNFKSVYSNDTGCYVKASYIASATLSSGKYWLEILLTPSINLSLLFDGRLTISRRGTNMLEPDTDYDGLWDGMEQTNLSSPLTKDADADGLEDVVEFGEGTKPLCRDTDMDGLRDNVETTISHPSKPQSSSYFDRLLLFGSPFCYFPMSNWQEFSSKTSPTNPDSDGDGLPDGFIDGWRYYPDETGKYRAENWHSSGICDGKIQVWEFEDINLNSRHDNFTFWGMWDFSTANFEVAHYFENGFIRFYGETNATNFDTDGDWCPDGYEVLYATKEPFDRYWEPRKSGILHLLNPLDSGDGARDVDIFEEELEEDTKVGFQGPPIRPTFYNFTINQTITARAVVLNYSHVMEIKTIMFSASSNSSRITVVIYSGELGVGTPLDSKVVSVNASMSNVTVSFGNIYLSQGYIVFKRTSEGDSEAFIGGIKWYGNSDDTEETPFAYCENEVWKNLGYGKGYNFSIDAISFDYHMEFSERIPSWAVLIENPSSALISSISVSLDAEDPNNAGFIVEIREYTENQSVANSTLLWKKRVILNSDGWYKIDNPDITCSAFYIVLKYNGERFIWKENIDYRPRHSVFITEEGREFCIDLNPAIKLYTYSGFRAIEKARHGDGVNNSVEGLTGTNPLSENTDAFYSGSLFYNDSLNDSQELSMVVFRTNAVQGALTAANYKPGTWIEFRAQGLNGVTIVRYRYSWLMSDIHYINITNSSLTTSDNFKLYMLEDGSGFYRAADSENLYLWCPALPPELNQSYSGICHVFVPDFTTPTLLTDWHPNPNYRDKEIYVSSPFDIDTDDDGLRDGAELNWNLDVEEPNPYGITDLLSCAHDTDSDGDGLIDSVEIDTMRDSDEDGKPNMVDPDSDNDGVIDGKETAWNLDSDCDGKPNMVDSDSDNDGLDDGVELSPYLAARNSQIKMEYQIYVKNVALTPASLSEIEFCGNTIYVSYYQDTTFKIASGKFERYGEEQYLHPLPLNLGAKFAVNVSGAIFTQHGNNLVCYKKEQTGNYAERTVVKNVPQIIDLAVNLTKVFFATNSKVYAVDVDAKEVDFSESLAITDFRYEVIAANENGCYFGNAAEVRTPEELRVPTDTEEKKDISVLRDGSLVWATATGIYIASPPFSRFYPYLNTHAIVWNGNVKFVSVDSADNLYILTNNEFFMLKYAKSSPISQDTDSDGLSDSQELEPWTCGAYVEKVSTPKRFSYLERKEIPSAPYVNVLVPFTDMLNQDTDGDGLSDSDEMEGWEISVRDCSLLISSSLDPLAAYALPKSKLLYTFNVRGEPEILSTAEPIFVVKVNSNPLLTDTDCDGLSDGKEYLFTNPLDADTDNDGLTDWYEVGEDGLFSEGETSPVVRDTDGDGLPDGWFEAATDNTLANEWGYSAVAPLWKDGSNYGEGNWDVELRIGENGYKWARGKEIGEAAAVYQLYGGGWQWEDGKIKIEKFTHLTSPLNPDTDHDGVEDGTEALYLKNLRGTPYWCAKYNKGENPWCYILTPESDHAKTHILDLKMYDSDNDGLSDGEENWVVVKDVSTVRYIRNTVLDIDASTNTHLETDPTDPDCDDDGLLDGQEFEWRNNTDYDTMLGCWDDINAWDKDINDNGGLLIPETVTNCILMPNNTVKITVSNPISTFSTAYVNLHYTIIDPATNNEVETNHSYNSVKSFQGKYIWVAKPLHLQRVLRAEVRYYTTSALSSQYHDFSETYCVFRTNARYDEGAKRLIYTSDSWVVVPLLRGDGEYPNLTSQTRGMFHFENVVDSLPQEAKVLETVYGTTYAKVLAPDGAYVYMALFGDSSPTRDTNTLQYCLYIRYKLGDATKYLNFTYAGMTTDPTTAHSQKEFWQNHQETLDWRACSNLDSDFDGLSNHVEVLLGTNPNDADTDDDGLSDGDEVQKYGTDPKNYDTDGDGLPDGLELGVTTALLDTDITLTPKHFIPDADPTTKTDPLNKDTDCDGIYDGGEDANHNGERETTETSPLDADTDDDGLIDAVEYQGNGGTFTSPLNPDSDNDGLPDGLELGLTYGMLTADTDVSRGNFTSDADEGKSRTLPNDDDTDNDGIKDGTEDENQDGMVNENETDPNLADTDGDGLSDKEEIERYKTEPLCRDSDSDGLTDGTEVKRTEQAGIPYNRPATDPLSNDTDNDNLTDYAELCGWDYTVIWQKTKEKKGTYHTYSDPTKNDTDNDGL
ncbi:MAG: hypothetical protein QW620_06520, partial [Thermoplasmata archaeon]